MHSNQESLKPKKLSNLLKQLDKVFQRDKKVLGYREALDKIISLVVCDIKSKFGSTLSSELIQELSEKFYKSKTIEEIKKGLKLISQGKFEVNDGNEVKYDKYAQGYAGNVNRDLSMLINADRFIEDDRNCDD